MKFYENSAIGDVLGELPGTFFVEDNFPHSTADTSIHSIPHHKDKLDEKWSDLGAESQIHDKEQLR